MKISLITACYQAEATLPKTIASIAEQTHADLEWIFIDGGSRDQSLAIAQQQGAAFLTHCRSEPDQGIYDAINKGLSIASGEIVGLLHSDDQLAYPQALSDIAKAFQDPSIDALYGDLQYRNGGGKVLRHWRSGSLSLDGWNSFPRGFMVPHPTLYLRRSFLEQVGPYRLDLGSAADYEFMLRALHIQRAATHYLPKVLVHMQSGGTSNANLKARLAANRFDRLAWQKNGLNTPFFLGLLKPLRKLSQYF